MGAKTSTASSSSESITLCLGIALRALRLDLVANCIDSFWLTEYLSR